LHRLARVCDHAGMQTPGSPLPAPVLEASPGFSAGSVLSRGFSVWASNLPLFLGVSLACYLPLLLIPAADPANPASGLVSTLALVVLQSLIAPIVSGAVIRGVFEQLRGNRASFGDSLGVAIGALWRILGTTFAAGIIVVLCSFLLIVPGIVMACSYYVAIPAAVVEGTGVSGSLSRSRKLAQGYRWHIFGILLVGGLLGALIGAVAGVLFRGVSGQLQTLLVAVVPNAIVGSLSAVFSGVGYYQLRVAKEGIDIQQLAAVFD
jgi:hypothetical protein